MSIEPKLKAYASKAGEASGRGGAVPAAASRCEISTSRERYWRARTLELALK